MGKYVYNTSVNIRMVLRQNMHLFPRRFAVLLVIMLVIGLSGCTSSANGPAQAVQGYLQAVVAKDSTKAGSLSCAAWESSAQLEVDSFAAVTAKLDGLSCKENGKSGSDTLVSCEGKIVTTYNNENQEITLSGRIYKVVQENGDWRMCGYQ
jgi:hypothetical protein